MKIDIIYAIPSIEKITDNESGLVSLINIIENGTVNSIPGYLPKLYFSSFVIFEDAPKNDNGHIEFCVQLWHTNPKNKKQMLFEHDEVSSPESKMKLNILLDKLPVESIGLHHIYMTIIADNKKKNSTKYPIQIELSETNNK